MVLDVEHADLYAPLNTGLHKVYLNEKKEGDKGQHFYYDLVEHKIHNEFLPNDVLLEGYNGNIVMYKDLNLERQKFSYNRLKKQIVNDETHDIVTADEGPLGQKANLKISKPGSDSTHQIFELDMIGPIDEKTGAKP